MANQDGPVLRPDDKLAGMIVSAIEQIFMSAFQTGCQANPPDFDVREEGYGDVTGVIGLAHPGLKGMLSVSFPKSTILSLLSRVYRTELTELNSSAKDGVGEVTNIIYGILKRQLNELGYSFGLAMPSVIIGQNHMFSACSDQPCVRVTFTSEVGEFEVRCSIEERQS